MTTSIVPIRTFICVWLHAPGCTVATEENIKKLKKTFQYFRIFTTDKDFYDYMGKDQFASKIILIISHTEHDQTLYNLAKVPGPKEYFQGVYRFLPQSASNNIDLFNNIDGLFQRILNDLNSYLIKERQNESTAIFRSKSKTYIRCLHEESKETFMFLTALKILLQMTHDANTINEMLRVLRVEYHKVFPQIKNIDKLQKYKPDKAIEYYTDATCLFAAVNEILRTEDIKEIFPFRVYVTDLHNGLREKNRQGNFELPLNVSRGTTMPPSLLQELIDNEKGYITMNGFLSTSMNRAAALRFAAVDTTSQNSQVDEITRSVLFKLCVDKDIQQSFAHPLEPCYTAEEDEILFSVGTIWYIETAKDEKSYWEITLKSYDELNPKLEEIYKQYTQDGDTLIALGNILYTLGDTDGAEWFYQRMLEDTSLDDQIRACLHNKIGMIRKEKKNEDYRVALYHFEEALKALPLPVEQSTECLQPRPHYIDSNQSVRFTAHFNSGFVQQKLGRYSYAIKSYEKALEVGGTELEKADVHNNMGIMFNEDGFYFRSLKEFITAIQLLHDSGQYLLDYNFNFERAKTRCTNYVQQHGKRNKSTMKKCVATISYR
ncbi:unnamed protein product [Rotaria sp. Silwood2]|nr:unnamed protein product [Rotaria sp. Silwood2]CAF4362670.1 unnamed protein product [Rotaria sp. Silwood2]